MHTHAHMYAHVHARRKTFEGPWMYSGGALLLSMQEAAALLLLPFTSDLYSNHCNGNASLGYMKTGDVTHDLRRLVWALRD